MKKINCTNNVTESICNLYSEGNVSVRDLARKFGMSHVTISKILSDNNITIKAKAGCKSKINAEDLAKLVADKLGYEELAEHFGVAVSTIRSHLIKNHLRIYRDDRISPSDLQHMYELRNECYSNSDIARKIGCSTATVVYHIGNQPAEITEASLYIRDELRAIAHKARKNAKNKIAFRLAEEARIAEEARLAEEERIRREEEERRAALAEKQNEIIAKLAAWGISCEGLTASELTSATNLVTILARDIEKTAA